MKRLQPGSAFTVFLVKPSKYDDQGFVIRHWRAVVPSNSLACLYGLTDDVRRRRLLGDVDLSIRVVDEAVTKIPLDRIARLSRQRRVLVCLVGVQTNQFCRASDIALSLRRQHVPVMIGGFHVSGVLSIFGTLSPEIQQLVNAGVTVVAGEVEHCWADLLQHAYQGTLQPVYSFLDHPPDLSHAPCPINPRQFTAKYAHANYGTIDCSRGCPFNCSFCTIINVQGRKSRYRSPECIIESIRKAYRESGVNLYFFTDDNFARNPAWDEILDRLIALRQNEGLPIEFVIQTDMPAYRIPGFIEKAVRAGCCTVFIGMESLNPRNIQAAGKTQNRVQDYRACIEAWHQARVTTVVGYIIGFPFDTEDSVRHDVRRLITEVRPDQASFFILTPLPGSSDHRRMIETGAAMDSDYNRFDCFHEATTHPHMKDGAWTRAYAEAWRAFYSLENMKAILRRAHPEKYWDVFFNLFWYKNSVVNEGTHPMLSGFFRFKDRESRRSTFPRESRLAHLGRRVADNFSLLRSSLRLALEMEELWLATRRRGEREGLAHGARQTRRDLARFWMGLRRELRRGRCGRVLRIDRIAVNIWWEIRLAIGFVNAMAAGKT